MKTVQSHDMITHRDLRNLSAVEEEVCVSLYLPTHPSAPDSHQDPIRLRNLLDTTEELLLKRDDLRRPDVEHLLKPAWDMVGDEYFWTHQSEGLAIFLTEDSHHTFRLPAPFDQTIEVGEHFLITPIISLLRPGQTFYLLAVSQNFLPAVSGKSVSSGRSRIGRPAERFGIGLGLVAGTRVEFPRPADRGQADAAMFHGHEEETKLIDLPAYLRKVVEPLRSMLYKQPGWLVFAGVKELFPIFQDVYGEEGLIPEHFTGNPDKLSGSQLHQRAWPIVEGHHRTPNRPDLGRISRRARISIGRPTPWR